MYNRSNIRHHSLVKTKKSQGLFRTILMAAVAMFVISSTARAQDYDDEYEEAETFLAITLSPLQLLSAPTVLELTGELSLPNNFSVAAIMGYGYGDSVLVSAGGVQGRYYLFGYFDHGFHIGVESSGTAATTSLGDINAASAISFNFGGFAGYKYTFRFGLVVEAQLGYQVGLFTATEGGDSSESRAQSGTSETTSDILLNINAGWAF